MKYIDADCLRAEIEQLNSLVPYDNDRHNEGLHDAYKAVKNVIDSRQQEQPELPPIEYYYQKGLHDGIIKGQIEILKGLEDIEKRKADPVIVIKQQEQPVIKKSNALFDKCVENCDPAVMKEVSDNVDKMLGRQPVEGLEEKDFVEEVRQYYSNNCTWDALKQPMLSIITRCARHFAEWGADHLRDVTKMVPDGLEEAAEEYRRESYRKRVLPNIDGPMPEYGGSIKDAFKAGAEWQKKQDQKTIELAEDHAMLAGMNKMEQQMLEGAVEGEICGRVYDHINVRFADGICKYLEPKNISHIPADVSKFKVGDKVRVIVIKEN